MLKQIGHWTLIHYWYARCEAYTPAGYRCLKWASSSVKPSRDQLALCAWHEKAKTLILEPPPPPSAG